MTVYTVLTRKSITSDWSIEEAAFFDHDDAVEFGQESVRLLMRDGHRFADYMVRRLCAYQHVAH